MQGRTASCRQTGISRRVKAAVRSDHPIRGVPGLYGIHTGTGRTPSEAATTVSSSVPTGSVSAVPRVAAIALVSVERHFEHAIEEQLAIGGIIGEAARSAMRCLMRSEGSHHLRSDKNQQFCPRIDCN